MYLPLFKSLQCQHSGIVTPLQLFSQSKSRMFGSTSCWILCNFSSLAFVGTSLSRTSFSLLSNVKHFSVLIFNHDSCTPYLLMIIMPFMYEHLLKMISNINRWDDSITFSTFAAIDIVLSVKNSFDRNIQFIYKAKRYSKLTLLDRLLCSKGILCLLEIDK